MTCIVGIAKDGEVYIGGDSFGGNSSRQNTFKRPKVFTNKEFIIGYTSSFRMGQLLEFEWKPPLRKYNDEGTEFRIKDDYEYIVKKIVPSIQSLFKEKGYGTIKDGEDNNGGTFLIGYKGNIYSIESDFAVLNTNDKYNSVGSGREIALGSLYSTRKWDDTEKRIELAIKSAEKYKPTVCSPVMIKCL